MSKTLATKYVATVLVAAGLILGFSLAFAQPAKADTLSDLQAQVQALLAQIATLQGSSSTTTTTSCTTATFTMNESQGMSGGQVMQIQQFLNAHGFQVSASGAGSPGNETSYFGPATKAAVVKFQNANAATILTPLGLSAGTGYWGPSTRAAANAMCSSSTTTTTTTGTPVTGSVSVMAGTQPANSLAPALASRVPFTTFTLTNGTNQAVTVNGIDVQRTGLAADAAFSGVVLIDQNGLQYGTSRTFNSNHQAEIGTPFTLNAGQSMTFTVAANMPNATTLGNYSGQVASISVTGIDTSVPVSGSLPITGAQQTINSSLAIGTASVTRSSYDPDASRTEPIGTTGLIFSGVRITAGSAENEKLYSITWNQTGSVGSTDLSNLVAIINGTSYPMTVDSTGKYYTATFPGGLTLSEGNSIDAYVQGDITGSDAAGRTVEFDIYRASDIYIVGQTYGYGITPTNSGGGTYSTNNNSTSGFQSTANPFYFGATATIEAGTLSTVGNASAVGAQNIAINVPNQPLGGFTTDFTGEPVTAQSVTVSVASTTSGGTGNLTSVSLVDQNGNTVAGPVDETSSGTLVFSSSVTFPVGPMTYTLKGTVPSGSTNGTTYTLSTNPSSNWLSPQGQTSGSSVSLTNTTITMSTMTVEGPQLLISAASTPASTTIAPGSSNMVIANINLDASQSGEDIRLAALPIVINASSTLADTTDMTTLAADLTNCQLYNGSTALNNQSIGSTGWANKGSGVLEANFIFQNSLTIPKGTISVLSVECNISSSILSTASFSAGVNSTYVPSPTGVQSGIGLSSPSQVNVTTSASGTMTPGTATLTANLDSSSPSYVPVAGGTTGVTVGAFNLQPTSDGVNLQKIGLSLNGSTASTSDVLSATIWQGSTQVGSVIFTGSASAGNVYLATTSVSINLPQNQQTVFTVKANLANVGSGQSGTDGHVIKIKLADAQGTGASSGTQVNSGSASAPAGVGLFRSYPTLAALSASSGTLVQANGQTLYEFSITPSAGGQGISLAQVGVTIATSSGSAANGTTTLANLKLYGFTDSAFSQPVPGSGSGGLLNTETYALDSGGVNTGNNKIVLDNGTTANTPLQLAAGTTYYFKVVGDIAQVAGSNGTHGTVQTYVTGGDTQNVTYPFMSAESTSVGSFVWSPNATTSPMSVNAIDWTNGYSIPGLPSTGMPATVLSN